MLFGGVFIAAEIRAAEACGVAFFSLAMLSDAEAAGGGAMTCHSILNPNLHVYDNSSLTTRRKIVRRAAPLKSPPKPCPFKRWTQRRLQGKQHKPARQSHSRREWA